MDRKAIRISPYLSPTQEKDVCAQINALYSHGYKMRQIIPYDDTRVGLLTLAFAKHEPPYLPDKLDGTGWDLFPLSTQFAEKGWLML